MCFGMPTIYYVDTMPLGDDRQFISLPLLKCDGTILSILSGCQTHLPKCSVFGKADRQTTTGFRRERYVIDVDVGNTAFG